MFLADRSGKHIHIGGALWSYQGVHSILAQRLAMKIREIVETLIKLTLLLPPGGGSKNPLENNGF